MYGQTMDASRFLKTLQVETVVFCGSEDGLAIIAALNDVQRLARDKVAW
jgi:hypothetical protein